MGTGSGQGKAGYLLQPHTTRRAAWPRPFLQCLPIQTLLIFQPRSLDSKEELRS